jgi:hypothetical protein
MGEAPTVGNSINSSFRFKAREIFHMAVRTARLSKDEYNAGESLTVKVTLSEEVDSIDWLVFQIHGQISFSSFEDSHDIVHPPNHDKLSFSNQYEPAVCDRPANTRLWSDRRVSDVFELCRSPAILAP